MSIILDALKKAEKERGSTENGASPEAKKVPIFNPAASIPKKMKKGPPLPMNLILLIVMGVVIAGGAFWLVKLRKKAPSAQPMAQKTQATVVEDPTVVRGEALDLYEQKKYDGSLQKWLHLTELQPNDAEAFNNLGVVYKKLNKKTEAEQAYTKALELNADYPEALNNMGILLWEEKKDDAALEYFEKATTLNSDFAEPHFHLAVILEQRKMRKEAAQYYERFLQLSPEIEENLKGQIEMRISLLRLGSEHND